MLVLKVAIGFAMAAAARLLRDTLNACRPAKRDDGGPNARTEEERAKIMISGGHESEVRISASTVELYCRKLPTAVGIVLARWAAIARLRWCVATSDQLYTTRTEKC